MERQTHEVSRTCRAVAVMPIALGLLVVGGAGAAVARSTAQLIPARRSTACVGGTRLVVASHPDDPLIFLSPDLLHDVQKGRCVRTVIMSAGDNGSGRSYWTRREAGLQAAFAEMGGVPDTWRRTDAGIARHPMPLLTSIGRPSVSLVFMRLPDGGASGQGTAAYGWQSLEKLYRGAIPRITAVDASSSYTREELTATLTSLIRAVTPGRIYTHDVTGHFGDGDHSDHHAVADLVRAADRRYRGAGGVLVSYLGYASSTRNPDLSGTELEQKRAAYLAYAPHDLRVCQTETTCERARMWSWLSRQYVTAVEYRDGSSDLARTATVAASSQGRATGQLASKAVDGTVDGYPQGTTREWATVHQRVGAWLRLSWPVPHSIRTVVLYDRPNRADQITAATLSLSNGSRTAVPALRNDGLGVTVSLAPTPTKSLLLRITGTSATTLNVGLAEIEVYAATP